MMEPTLSSSSSSDDSSSSSSDDDSSSSSEEECHVPIQSIDDLPSDDSVSVNSSSSSHEEDNSDEQSENDESSSDDDNEEDNTILQERLLQKQNQGLSPKILAQNREKKSRAREIALQKMAAVHKKNNKDNTDKKETKTKKSKHAPTEASSKRSDYFARGAPQLNSSGIGVEIGKHCYKPRDPRMNISSGSGDMNNIPPHLHHTYALIKDLRQKEIENLRKRISARQVSGKKGQKARRKLGLTAQGSLEQDRAELQRLLQEQAAYERFQLDTGAKRAVKQKLVQEVAQGKHGAYYPKRREMKRMVLEAKFEQLRKRGGDAAVDKVVAKRRKKNKGKQGGFF